MIRRFDISKAASRLSGCTALLLGLTLIPGCGGEAYPQNLDYPLRTDPIIMEQPKNAESKGFDKPGELFHLFDAGNHPLDDVVQYPKADPRPGKKGGGIKAADRAQLEKALKEVFGTPAKPFVDGISSASRGWLKLQDPILEQGSKLYRLHCLHCHGLTGDGRGPTAPWVHPHPRDYRQGIFKFSSSKQDVGVRKPRRADLARTVREGIEGTSMPSFQLLVDEEVEALVSYVIHLSLRGEAEYQVMKELLNPKADIKDITEEVKGWAQRLANDSWMGAEQEVIAPADRDYPYKTSKSGEPILPRGVYTDGERAEVEARLRESVQMGQKLFKSKEIGCIGCHIDYGRQNRFLFDAWGTTVRPANLTLGVYRGGRRPIDLYYRIHSGINGANMPAAKDAVNEKGIWDIVNFLQVLPYPEMRKKYGIKIDDEK